MKRGEFVTTVANITGLSESVVLDVLESAGDVVADLLRDDKAGEAASVPGFGKFTAPRGVLASWGSTPGGVVERVEVPAADRSVKFAPGKSFRRMFSGTR